MRLKNTETTIGTDSLPSGQPGCHAAYIHLLGGQFVRVCVYLCVWLGMRPLCKQCEAMWRLTQWLCAPLDNRDIWLPARMGLAAELHRGCNLWVHFCIFSHTSFPEHFALLILFLKIHQWIMFGNQLHFNLKPLLYLTNRFNSYMYLLTFSLTHTMLVIIIIIIIIIIIFILVYIFLH